MSNSLRFSKVRGPATLPRPLATGSSCAGEGCERPAIGDTYCSRKCCELAHGLTPEVSPGKRWKQ